MNQRRIYVRSSKSAAWVMIKDLFRAVFGIENKYIFKKKDVRYLWETPKGKRTWDYIKSKGYINEINELEAQFTDLAKINLLAEIVKTRKLDGKSRLVVFDIPEKIALKRAVLRSHLKELGFKQWQKSVWISKLPCDDLVTLVAKYHGLDKYLGLFVGERVTANSTDRWN